MRRQTTFWIAVAAATVVLSAALAVVWARDDRGGATAARGDGDPGPVHVHGLGVNPGDGALYIATHTGLWRLREGVRRPERVGESRQDTMGFTVAGADHFLGSGHPDDVRRPPLLGLIESRSRGEDWDAVSLLGEADFHVLRTAGGRIYGYDVTNDRLMVSGDGGQTWVERHTPAPVIDLAVRPGMPDELLASTERGLMRSMNGGASWTAVGAHLGLLAWPAPAALYLVSAAGDVMLSEDGGSRWARVGELGGPPAAVTATAARALYAALHDGPIVRSHDGGRTWRALTA